MAYIFGTAGHIDHGKTTLVKILSGIECDTLQEEQNRGITIQLGFAHMCVGNCDISIIDVPGHEKFIKTMVSGVSGIDAVLFVISAEEGIMPQTVEHFEILSLLGIQNVIVVLTKVDCVSEEWCELIKLDIQEFFSQHGFPTPPILCVSSVTKKGIPELISAMEHIIQNNSDTTTNSQQAFLATNAIKPLPTEPHTLAFRLPLDRVFTLKGHGTVVTGTSTSGTVSKGDTLMVYPQKTLVRVKNVQRHNADVAEQSAGVRTALNLHGISYSELHKGDVIATPHSLETSQHWEVVLHCLPSSPFAIKHRTHVHVYHYTKETLARIYCLDGDTIEPGETKLCKLYFETPMVGVALDRCVIRSGSPLTTIGGCIVLNPLADRLAQASKKNTTPIERNLLSLLPESLYLPSFEKKNTAPNRTLFDDILMLRLRLAQEKGLTLKELSLLTAQSIPFLHTYIQNLENAVSITNERYIDAFILKKYSEYIKIWVSEKESANPLAKGVPLAELYTNFTTTLPREAVDYILEQLIHNKILERSKEYVSSAQHKVILMPKQELLKHTILDAIYKGGDTPPSVAELKETTQASHKDVLTMLSYLCNEGILVRVSQELYYPTERIDKIKGILLSFFTSHKELTLADFKTLLGGISRKYIVALLEFFDDTHFTYRKQNARYLV